MDINIPSDLPAAKPAASTPGDLLARLRASGAIEAEVVSVLQGKLLLSSRLGDILTSNRLGYGPGDRLSLRLDDSTGTPVLKASPAPPKIFSLDSKRNPDLARLLTPGRALLSSVVNSDARTVEIRVAGQTLALQRQFPAARGQLLSLTRENGSGRIEIIPIERKAIYKAVLKNLIPRQSESDSSSLVRLIEFARKLTAAPRNTIPGSEKARVGDAQSHSPAKPLPGQGAGPKRDAYAGSRVATNGKQHAGLPTQPATTTTPLAGAPPTALQHLSRLAASLPEIDAARIKSWFQLAGLVKPVLTGSTTTSGIDFMALLKKPGGSENLARELSQAIRTGAGTSSGGDAAEAADLTTREAMLRLAREGARLVEQSLSQNLFQRSSLGLQQETQQPLSFSLAAPLLDDGETRPFYIDLAERGPASQHTDKCWDIRLSFEFAGLGPISCHLVLEGLALAASFYSEQVDTRDRIETSLPDLTRQLTEAGFQPGGLYSFQGRPAATTTAAVGYSESLIDIEV